MANSLFFMPTNQNSTENPNDSVRNTYPVNGSGEIQTQPPQNTRGRKPGSKTCPQKPKKQPQRGMGVARLERLRIEEERKNMLMALGGRASPNGTLSPDPGVVLQGFPSYAGGPNMSVGGYTLNRVVGSGQIPVYNPSNNRCDTCFKKQRIDGDQNVVRSNGGGFSKYPMVPHLVSPDQRSQGFLYDHRVASYSTPPSASSNQVFNQAISHRGSMEETGSENPRNETRDVKEYEFFPGAYGNKPVSSVSTSLGDCGPSTSTIDLSLKL
ncbi:unnamed protein product [Eruca vesicaria subsp. sativa]|uniref:Uncharacterized protein n=1 Tax=Eruca vesicaria subsp. sativa TaxID=29727 RepID=A0ABC8KAU7_ERUVS|nr:unnamed protein product [Eruca vesicaria subsp. sativa]